MELVCRQFVKKIFEWGPYWVEKLILGVSEDAYSCCWVVGTSLAQMIMTVQVPSLLLKRVKALSSSSLES